MSEGRSPAVGSPGAAGDFTLYVEGARDHEIVLAWAQRDSRVLARALATAAVILGGRQPARAVEHARERRQIRAGAEGLCVLDRDAANGGTDLPPEEPGLAFFTWSRRHIESYLLVPAAIRRSLRLPEDDRRVERALHRWLGDPIDEQALRDVDAKRLLARTGELARVLGLPLAPGRIARAMRVEEFHADVRALLAALRAAFRLGTGSPRVAVRTRRRGGPPVGGMLPSGG